MVRYADFLLGELVAHLEKLGLSEKTLIVWTTDNGSTEPDLSNHLNGRLVYGAAKPRRPKTGSMHPLLSAGQGPCPPASVSEALVDFSDMLPTFADFAGAEPEPGYTYDGVSLKEVFLGESDHSDRDWILAMGSKPARMTDSGVENTHVYRDRVLRNERYKLFVGPDRRPEKLIDLNEDLEETNDLSQNSEYVPALNELMKAAARLPLEDADPDYRRSDPEAWWKKARHMTGTHKVQPD
jgi:arylsulfatase A-like enzyme